MNSVNATLRDKILLRTHYLSRFETAQYRALLETLQAAHDSVIAKIATTGGKETKAWLSQVLLDLDGIYAEAFKQMGGDLTDSLKALSKLEAEWAASTLDKTIPLNVSVTTPSPAQVWAAVSTSPADRGHLLSELMKGMERGTVDKITAAIRQGVVEGETVDDMVRRIRGTVVRPEGYVDAETGKRIVGKTTDQMKAMAKRGEARKVPGVYQGGAMETSTRSAEALARTAVMHVSNVARGKVNQENADLLDGEQWVATLDTRTCAECGPEDGKVYPVGEGPVPPLHFNCLPGNARVSSGSRVLAVTKRVYKGKMFVLRTASGNEITATPNHPVLTGRGWVAVQGVNLGDHLVSDLGIQRVVLPSDGEHDHVESSIEEVFDAALKAFEMRPSEVPLTAKDFHGDASDGEVAVVAFDRCLPVKRDAAIKEEVCKPVLVMGGQGRAVLVPGDGSFVKLFRGVIPVLGSLMGLFHKVRNLFRGRHGHSGGLLFGSTSPAHPVLTEEPDHDHPCRAESFGNAGNADAGFVQADDVFNGEADGRPGIERHPSILKALPDDLAIDAEMGRNIRDGLSGPVALDQVVDIRQFDFSGHVFNLQTETGWFLAGNIVTHNCRCVRVPVVKSWKDLGFDLADVPEGSRASMDGQVPESLTYGEWLKTQSAEVQRDALGASRAALFRDGMSIDRFVRDGRTLRLDELKD